MRTSTTFSIRFWADSQNAKNNLALVYARVTVNQKRLSLSLKKRVPLHLWDAKSQRLTGNSNVSNQFNQYLVEVQTQLFQIYQNLKFKGVAITAQKVKSAYCGEHKIEKTLIDLIKYHSKKIEHTHAIGSIRNFAITENYIKKFLLKEKKTADVSLNELDYKFLCDFERYLHSYYPKKHDRQMSHNTVMKHIQRLRKIVTLAYHLEWLDKDPFRRWKMTFEKKERDFLTANELSNLENYVFPIKRLERVRDLFLFSCYTGLCYIDIKNLTKANILKGIEPE